MTGRRSSATSRTSTRAAAAPGWKAYFYIGESRAALGADGRPAPTRAHFGTRRSQRRTVREALRARGSPRAGHDQARAGRRLAARARSTRRRSRRFSATMDGESDNFTAELVLKQLGAVAGQAARPPAARRSSARRSPSRASRSAASGSPTAPGSRSLDRLTAEGAGRRSSSRVGRPRPRARLRSAASRSPAGRHARGTGCAAPPARGNVCAKTGTTRQRLGALAATSRDRYAFAILQNGSAARLGARARRTGSRPVLAAPSSFSSAASSAAARRRCCAFVSFDARAPRRRRAPVVFFETESSTFAPSRLERRRRLVAREALERAGDDVGRAGQRALGGPLLLPGLEAQPELAQLLDERAVLLVREPLGDRSRRGRGRCPRPPRSPPASLASAGRRAEVAREVLGHHPADLRDVQPEEDARERHLLRRLDRVDRAPRPRSPRSRRAPAAAPSSGGRGRAASGRGPRSQSVRIDCSPTPSMSARPRPS